ncbi:MAG: glycosyltransferase family 9 protein [Deltaproteobacteria bacterium]|nr:glycosyltransferase family 9 protein [Deltaproteobacteria bacterium]
MAAQGLSERITGIPRLRKTRDKKIKFLVVRPDRIGDVVLSTPVLEALKQNYPAGEIHMLVRDSVVPVVRHNPHLDRIIVYRPNSVHWGIAGFIRLWRAIRRERYDIAIVLQVQAKPSLAVFLAGIRYRIGPYSKWYSYLIFNRGKRQSRSSVAMHETDYNLMLLRRLGIRVPARKISPHVTVDADAKDRMRNHARAAGLGEAEPFVVVHPGMGGSAMNWPEGYYVDLIKRIAVRGTHVFVTGVSRERALVERVAAEARALGPSLPVHPYVGEDTDSGLSDFIALLSLSKVVVAPSTGPLHIATALGKRTVSFFSPIKVQSALRWGPYSPEEGKHSVLVPDALCGQDFKCAGPKCIFYFCMERLGVDEALQSVLHQLESEKT